MVNTQQTSLIEQLQQHCPTILSNAIQVTQDDMVTVELLREQLLPVCQQLRDCPALQFVQLLDLCGVDYAEYGQSEWRTDDTTATGFSRGVNQEVNNTAVTWEKPRYAVVYHLLSYTHNRRLRLKVYLDPEPELPSVIDIWPAANWYEREAYDLFGIVFTGHPDLRRLLTDYGFIGHPLRKDFPLIGQVEMRYDGVLQRCVYEPTSIQPRVLVPKVIRRDSRYLSETDKKDS